MLATAGKGKGSKFKGSIYITYIPDGTVRYGTVRYGSLVCTWLHLSPLSILWCPFAASLCQKIDKKIQKIWSTSCEKSKWDEMDDTVMGSESLIITWHRDYWNNQKFNRSSTFHQNFDGQASICLKKWRLNMQKILIVTPRVIQQVGKLSLPKNLLHRNEMEFPF